MRADVTMFQQHVFTRPDGTFEEKSIDVWLALEAYEMASLKKYDLIVLISGDGDFVPMVRKLNTLGTKVMLQGWDFSFEYKGRMQRTRVSSALIERANYTLMMDAVIDARERRSDPFVNNLFLPQAGPIASPVAPPVAAERVAAEGEPGQPALGSIAHLALDKGFGFIKPDEQEGSSLFFHVSELQGVTLPELSLGSRVRFVFGTNERGSCARSVSLEPSPAIPAGALESELNSEKPMSIKSDRWIRRMAEQHGMIEPFEPGQVREVGGRRIVSYGTSSYGYDIRCAPEFKVFTNVHSTVVDPKNFDEKSFVNIESDVCIIPPNSFALARTVEYFRIPRNVLTICLGKSTYARCGIIVNVTPFEPEWEGHVTLEFSNTTPLPAKIYAGEGCAQCCSSRAMRSARRATATAVASTRDKRV